MEFSSDINPLSPPIILFLLQQSGGGWMEIFNDLFLNPFPNLLFLLQFCGFISGFIEPGQVVLCLQNL